MLVIQNGQMAGQRWIIDGDVVVIGREPGDMHVLVPERQVSRKHAEIKRSDDGFWLNDLSSKNGTFLNGKEVRQPTLLRDGDEIQIALCVKIAFVGSDATAPLNARPISQSMRAAVRGVRIDKETRNVFVTEQPLDPPLSVQQYRLLELLMDSNGSLISRSDIADFVWEHEDAQGVTEQAIDALVRRLRDRVAELDAEHEYIVTVRGHGFRFEQRR